MRSLRKNKLPQLLSVFFLSFCIILLIFSIVNIFSNLEFSSKNLIYETPTELLDNIEQSLLVDDYSMFKTSFYNEAHAKLFNVFLFGINEKVDFLYGNSDSNPQNIIKTHHDLVKNGVNINEINCLDDNTCLAHLFFNTERIKINFIALIQNTNDGWKITRLYDFLFVDNAMLSVTDFNIDFMTSKLNFDLGLSEQISEMGETTLLYNTYLMIETVNVDLVSENDLSVIKNICYLLEPNFEMYDNGSLFVYDENSLKSIDTLRHVGSCNFADVASTNPYDKYLIRIKIKLSDGNTIKLYYYGDLRL